MKPALDLSSAFDPPLVKSRTFADGTRSPSGQSTLLDPQYTMFRIFVPLGRSVFSAATDAEVSCGADILNRQELLSVPLEQAPPQMKLVQSLIPIWEDETRRSLAAGRPPPATPTSADDSPRVPQPPTDVEVRLRRAVYKLAEEEEALLGKRHGASPAEEEPGGAEQGPGQAEAADTPGTAAGGDGRREASQEPSPIGSAEESGRAGSQRLQAGEGTRESQPRDQRSVLAGPALPESPGPPTPVPPPGASPLFGSSQQPQRSPFTPASGLVRVFGSQPGGSQRSSQGARNQDSLFTLTQAANQAKTAGDKSPLDDMGLASPDDWRGGGGATQELGGGRSPAFKRSRFSQEEGDHSTKTAGSKALDFSGTAEEDEEGLVDEAIMTQVTQGFSKGVESADRDLYEALAGLGGSDDEERGEEGWAERGENRGFSRPVQKWKGKTTKEEGESSQELLDILEMLGAQDGRKETGEGLGEKAADVSRSRGGGVDVGPQDRREVDGEGADERAADVSRLRGGGPMQSDERGWLGKVGMEEEDAESGEEASVRYSRQEGGVGRETDNRNDKQGKGPAVNVGRPTAFAAPLRKPKTEPEEADSLGQSIQSGGDRFPGFPGSWQGQGFGPKVKTEKKEGGEAGVLNASVPKRDRAGQQLSLREQMRRQRDRRPTGAAKLVGREHKKEKRGEQDKSISGVDPGRESTSVRDSTQVAEASKAAKAARFGGLSFGATKGGVVQLRTPKQETDIADRHRQGVPEARDGAQQKRHSAVPAFEAGGLSETTLGGSQRGRDSRGSDVRAAALEAAAVLQVSGSKRRSESSEQPEGNKLVRVKREALSPQPEPSRSQGPSSHPPDGPILDSAESQRSFKAVSEEPASGGTGQPGRAALSLSAQSAESPSRSEEANEANDLADLKLAVELGLSGREESLETEWDGTETGEDKLVQSPARDTPKFYHDMLPNDQLRLDGRANDFTGGVAEGYTAAGGPETADGSVQAEGTAHAEDTGPGFASQHLATAKLESEGPDDMEAESPSESVSDWGSSGGSEGEGASRAYDDLRLAEELGLFKGELAPDAGDAARVKTEPGVSEELEGAEEVGVGGEEKGTERGKEGSLPGAGGEAKPVLRFVKVEPTEDEDLKPGLHLDEGLYRIVSPPSERAAVKPETEGLLEEEEWQNEPDLSADPGALSGRRAVSADAGATEGLPIGEASVEDEKQRPVTNTARMSPAGTEGAEGRSSADRDLNQGDQPLSRSQSPKMKEEVDRSKEVETTPPSPFRSSGESPHLAQPSPLSPAKPSASPHESFSPKVGKASELALVVSGKAAEPENGGAGSGGTFVWRYGKAAPSAAQLRDTWQQHGLHEHAYGGAFYGNPKDVPERSAIFAGLEFNRKSSGTKRLISLIMLGRVFVLSLNRSIG